LLPEFNDWHLAIIIILVRPSNGTSTYNKDLHFTRNNKYVHKKQIKQSQG